VKISEIIFIAILTWIVFKIIDVSCSILKTIDYNKLFSWICSFKITIFAICFVFGLLGALPVYYLVYFEILPLFTTDGPEKLPKALVYYWLTIFHIASVSGYCVFTQMIVVQYKQKFNPFIGLILSFLIAAVSVPFCFTAGFVVIPLMIFRAFLEFLTRVEFGVKIGFKDWDFFSNLFSTIKNS
jgi:hypothetical protein